jgi:hypothetical protein
MTNNFYVYAHYKPDGNIFYIGKGHGGRAWKTSGRGEFWYRTVRKHGGYHIVLLHKQLTEDEAFQKEKEEIEFWGRRKDGGFLINLTDGGDGVSGYKFTKEQYAKVKAVAQKRSQDPAYRAKIKASAQKRAQDPEWKANVKAGAQKRAQDPEWKANVKAGAQKRAQDPAYRAKVRASMQKKAQDPAWRAKNKAAIQKLTQDPEWKAKNKAALQKRAIEFSVVAPNGTVYLTQRNLREFCKTHGLEESCMRRVLKGKRKYHLRWKKYIPPINTLLDTFI